MNDEATQEKTGPDFEVYPAISDLQTKQDIIEHIFNVHGITNVDGQSLGSRSPKITKERLLEVHGQMHENLARATWRWEENSVYDNASNTYMGSWRPYLGNRALYHGNRVFLPHRHETLSETAALREAATAVRTGGQISDKPLPTAQLRLLTEIVRQDFRIIEQEMREFATEALEAKHKDIRAEYEAKKGDAPKLRDKAQAKLAKLQEELRQMREEAAAAGITLTTPHFSAGVTYEIKGLADALKTAKEENAHALNRAIARLEREKAVALRRVQLAGISPEAVKLLDELPDARQMMVEAAAQKPKEIG